MKKEILFSLLIFGGAINSTLSEEIIQNNEEKEITEQVEQSKIFDHGMYVK